MPPTSVNVDSDDSKKWKVAPRPMLQRKILHLNVGQYVYTILLIVSHLPQLSYLESCLARVQHLSAHEKDRVQDFRN